MLTIALIIGFAIVMFIEAGKLTNLTWLFRLIMALGLTLAGFIIIVTTSALIGIAITPLMPTQTMDPFGAGEITMLTTSGFYMLTAISGAGSIAALLLFFFLSKRLLRRFRKDESTSFTEPIRD